jgi:hypothetical protein
MNTKGNILTWALIAILLIGVYFYFSKKEESYTSITTFKECVDAGYPILETYPEQCKTPDKRTFVNPEQTPPVVSTTTPTTGKEDLIVVSNVVANQILESPLTIEGSARGLWYFEASFPVELLDGNGKRLTIKPAQAQGEWMTIEFVPFSVTLTFVKPTTATGTLILHKDNPSGEPSRDDSLRIPVRFSTSERSVKLYYYKDDLDKDANGNILCSSKGLVPVTRSIPISISLIQDTIRLFLRGELTATEKNQGISTEYPLQNVTLTSASLSKTGALVVNLADPNNKTSGGACRATVLKAQLEATVKQFTEVKNVTFSPNTLFQP